MTSTEPATKTTAGAGSAFPIEWPDPADSALEWRHDELHSPSALAPLSIDYAETIASGFNPVFELFGSPMRRYIRVLNGFVYHANDPGVPETGVPAMAAELRARHLEGCRDLSQRWVQETLPEVQRICAGIAEVAVEQRPGPEVARAWENAWAAAERAWFIHFVVVRPVHAAVEAFADVYESIVEDASPGEALQVTQGSNDVLYDVDAGLERLAAVAAAWPDVAVRLQRQPAPGIKELRAIPGGSDLVRDLEGFLATHGHLGQTDSDLTTPSWSEEPSALLGDLGARLAHPPEPSSQRRARLLGDAAHLVDRARARARRRPDARARLEETLARVNDVGHLTETHNYWIDRLLQARLRSLTLRVGRRLVVDRAIEDAADVFYLRRSEVSECLIRPRDRRSLIADRRAEHERQRALRPPSVLGRRAPGSGLRNRFFGSVAEPSDLHEAAADQIVTEAVLKGTGASVGVARGPARVAHGPDDFPRIQPGDIVVCPTSNPSWVPVFAIAGGLVTNSGGVLAHAAVVAREFGLPAVVGVAGATSRIPDGREIEIDGAAGTVRLL